MFETSEYLPHQANARLCPFNRKYEDDLWVAYHGTSNHAEATIETDGFRWRDETYSRSEVEQVLRIFDLLYWCGTRTGGFPVLASFSESDFRRAGNTDKKAVF